MTSTAIAKYDMGALEQAAIVGDLKELSPSERLSYYQAVCQSMGLNPLSKPFDYITLNGKLTLYCRKDATDQLRKLHGVSVAVVNRDTYEGVHVVTAQARTPEGRTDEEIGAVTITGLKGDALANALMKAVTKAKRRVTLSICGLGWLDETEIETIRDSRPVAVDHETGVIAEPLPTQPQPERVTFLVTDRGPMQPVADPEPEAPVVLPVNVDKVRWLAATMDRGNYSGSIPYYTVDTAKMEAGAQLAGYTASAIKALAVASVITNRHLKTWDQLTSGEASALLYWSRPANNEQAKTDITAILDATWEGD